MSSCLLFHGPTARMSALQEAASKGRLLCPPIGEDGLTIDAAREVVLTLQSSPVGDQLGVLVIGPVDRIRDKSGDALLKSLEEIDTTVVLPLLWAHDLVGVSPTLRSRCLTQWCSGSEVESEAPQDEASEFVSALLAGALWRAYEIPQKWMGREPLLLFALVEHLVKDLPAQFPLWSRLRVLAQQKSISAIELVDALFPAESA